MAPDLRHSKVAVHLAVAWQAEHESAQRLKLLAGLFQGRDKARISVLGAFRRANASRLLSRLAAMGRGPLPVPREVQLLADTASALEAEAQILTTLRVRYEEFAETAREHADLSSAWVFELGRPEAGDAARELAAIAESLRQQPNRASA